MILWILTKKNLMMIDQFVVEKSLLNPEESSSGSLSIRVYTNNCKLFIMNIEDGKLKLVSDQTGQLKSFITRLLSSKSDSVEEEENDEETLQERDGEFIINGCETTFHSIYDFILVR